MIIESYLEQRPLRPIRRDDRAVARLGPEEGGELGALARLGHRAQLVDVLLEHLLVGGRGKLHRLEGLVSAPPLTLAGEVV